MADYAHSSVSASEPSSPRAPYRTRRRTESIMSTSSTQSAKHPFPMAKSTASIVATSRPGKHDAMGSFTPTGSATTTLRYLAGPKHRRRQLQPLWLDTYSDSPSPSGPPSPIIPSITRTASTSYVISPPSSPHAPIDLPAPSRHQRSSTDGMHPILASLERKSKLCVKKAQCATCKKIGADFPRCGKCSLMWCSRECRLVGGKRHVCRSQ